MKHLSEEDLILLYYGEPGVSNSDARAHLAECEQCKEAAEALSRTLDLCSEWTAPEPRIGFERGAWARLEPEIAGKRSAWLFPRTWMAAAAAVILLVGAFLLGRGSRAPRPTSPSIMAGLSSQARARILQISLADHLDRAGRLLTEISNAGDTASLDFAAERDRAQDLVDEGRLMRQTLSREGASPTLTFLDEVERFLLEVANAPDSPSPSEVRELRQRIGATSLLFKVRIIESNLRTQGRKL
ncbi:MAG TPA: hypothetical protein VHY84_07955 [Bryobacteraceae bacterium]|jgi:hypothetical protein|nr:hypothetical protein [Bryobacteraceae bacterium]